MVRRYYCRVWYRGQPLVCDFCREEGRRGSDCLTEDKCRKCGGSRQFARACTVAPPSFAEVVDGASGSSNPDSLADVSTDGAPTQVGAPPLSSRDMVLSRPAPMEVAAPSEVAEPADATVAPPVEEESLSSETQVSVSFVPDTRARPWPSRRLLWYCLLPLKRELGLLRLTVVALSLGNLGLQPSLARARLPPLHPVKGTLLALRRRVFLLTASVAVGARPLSPSPLIVWYRLSLRRPLRPPRRLKDISRRPSTRSRGNEILATW